MDTILNILVRGIPPTEFSVLVKNKFTDELLRAVS
jgi:hypothetical protein